MRVLQYGQPTRHHVFVWVIGLTAFRYSPFIPQLGHSSVVSNTPAYLSPIRSNVRCMANVSTSFGSNPSCLTWLAFH